MAAVADSNLNLSSDAAPGEKLQKCMCACESGLQTPDSMVTSPAR